MTAVLTTKLSQGTALVSTEKVTVTVPAGGIAPLHSIWPRTSLKAQTPELHVTEAGT